MPTLNSTDERLTPRSTLRHRPITADTTRKEPPRVRRATRTQTPQSTAAKTTAPADIPAWKPTTRLQRRRQQRIPLVGIGIGMVLAVVVVFLGQLVIGWTQNTWNDLHYGYPRTSQIDAVVGQGDSTEHPSHFIALNLKGQIEVIDLPAGDASRAKIYLGPHLYGQGSDLIPVTLQFVDTQNKHQPDMLVLVQGERLLFQNAHGSFHAPPRKLVAKGPGTESKASRQLALPATRKEKPTAGNCSLVGENGVFNFFPANRAGLNRNFSRHFGRRKTVVFSHHTC